MDFPSWKVWTIPAKSLIFAEGWKAGLFVFIPSAAATHLFGMEPPAG
jgi:hypothetical protein